MTKAKPFIKWVGGKSQLINILESQLPEHWKSHTNLTHPVKVF